MFDVYPIVMVMSVLINIGLAVLAVARRPGDEAARMLQQHATRITTLETALQHMPTIDEMRKLEGTVARIDERTTGVVEGIAGMRASLSRMEGWLMDIKRDTQL